MCPEKLRPLRFLLLFISFWLCLPGAWRQFAAVRAQGEQAPIIAAPSLTGRNEGAGNGRIAYATIHRRGEYRIYFINPDGSGVAPVLQQSLNVTGASWSPDGTRIVFTTGDRFPGGGAIRLVNADGSGLTQLTTGTSDRTPVFSPDGSKVAFVRATELYTMNADGTGQTKMPDTNIGPAISASDGQTVEPGLSWQRTPDAVPPTFVISGRVTGESGQGLAGKIELSGARTAMARTDRSGYFSFGNLAAGGDYTVALSPVFFTPAPSGVINDLNADMIAEFVVRPIRHTISGRITDSANTGMRGVEVGFRHLPSPGSYPTAVTDENGFYRLTDLLPRDGTEPQVFSVAPLAPFAFFRPFVFDVPRLTEDLTVNFTGTRSSIPLNGRVLDAEGRGVGGVTVTLGGARSRTATTGADGRFDLGSVPGGLDYTVTPAKDGLTFAPASRNLKLLSFSSPLIFRSGVALLTLVSPASLRPGPIATEGLVTAFGANLAAFTETARSPLGETRLGGVTVEIESEGARGNAFLTFASPTQLNLNLYFLGAPGECLFTVTSTTTGRVIAAGAAELARVAPALFAANHNGQGVPAAVALRVTADNRQTFEPVARFDAAQRQFVAVPLDLGPDGEQLFLVLYGLGIHNRSRLDEVKCQIGGVNAPVTFAGRAPNFFALDQVNVRLPRELAGRGEVDGDGSVSTIFSSRNSRGVAP